MSKETAEQIKLITWAKRHFWDSLEKDKDLIIRHLKTYDDAETDCTKCKANIKQQLIEEIENLINSLPDDTKNIMPLGAFLFTDEWQQLKGGE